jgi:hypothetical protein
VPATGSERSWCRSTPSNYEATLAGAAEREAKAVRCSCPDSPWCTGPTGPYWLSCARSCRACHPRGRRRPAVNTREGDDAPAD